MLQRAPAHIRRILRLAQDKALLIEQMAGMDGRDEAPQDEVGRLFDNKC